MGDLCEGMEKRVADDRQGRHEFLAGTEVSQTAARRAPTADRIRSGTHTGTGTDHAGCAAALDGEARLTQPRGACVSPGLR